MQKYLGVLFNRILVKSYKYFLLSYGFYFYYIDIDFPKANNNKHFSEAHFLQACVFVWKDTA